MPPPSTCSDGPRPPCCTRRSAKLCLAIRGVEPRQGRGRDALHLVPGGRAGLTGHPRRAGSAAHGELGSVGGGAVELERGHGSGNLSAVVKLAGELAVAGTGPERGRGTDQPNRVASPAVLVAGRVT